MNHVAAAGQSDRTRLVATVDLNRETAEQAAQTYGAAKALTDYREVLDDPSVGVVVVATPPSTHREIAEQALRKGKHVLCEKPLAGTLEEALALCRTAVETNRKLRVGYILRHNRTYQTVADMIHSGSIGAPMVMRMLGGEFALNEDHWKRDLGLIKETSPLIDCGCHYVDLMRWFSGEEAVSVCGVGARTEFDVPPDNFNYEMIGVALSKGSCGLYEVGWSRAYRNFSEKEFLGPKGRIRVTYSHDRLSEGEKGDLIEHFDLQKRKLLSFDVPGVLKPVTTELEELLDCIETDGDIVAGLNDALQSLAIVLVGHEAIQQGATLPVPRVVL